MIPLLLALVALCAINVLLWREQALLLKRRLTATSEQLGVRLPTYHARDVMTARADVAMIDADATVESAVAEVVSSGHTRLVVVGHDELVVGTVHLAKLAGKEPGDGIRDVMDDPCCVPETRFLVDLLADLRVGQDSMAIVLDEYGRMTGVLTIEDIVEEVVGEILDERDNADEHIQNPSPGIWRVSGHVSIDDLRDRGVDLGVPPGGEISVGGAVMGALGRLPKVSDLVVLKGWRVSVESMDGQRVEKLMLRGSARASAV